MWWPGTESNCRHYDFQSYALPTELPGRRAKNHKYSRTLHLASSLGVRFWPGDAIDAQAARLNH
jgi:hypothetical protein